MKVDVKNVQKNTSRNLACTSMSWNALGSKLFAGFTDGNIRVYKIN